MKPVVVIFLVLLVGVGAWFLLGEKTSEPVEPDTGNGQDAPAGTSPEGDVTLIAPGQPTGETLVPQRSPLKVPANALLIALHSNTWTKTLVLACQDLHQLGFASWYFETQGKDLASAEARGLTPFQEKPTAEFLETADIRALFFDSADPNAMPRAFWDTVARRVRSGRMGLYLRPNFPPSPQHGQPSPAVHPIMSHPVLKELIPVAHVQPFTGTPLPGVFKAGKAQPIRVTEAGTKHPATRFVPKPEDSRRAWAEAGTGDGAFASTFCYPVDELKPGAQVLANLVAGIDFPALIVPGDAGQRVLWMGNGDFGHRAHFVQDKRELQYLLINQWILWLVGQADE